MIGENQHVVTNEPVEFEKKPVEIQDCMKFTDHSRGIHRIYPKLIKENRRLSTYNQWDMQTLGSQPVIPINLPITGSCGDLKWLIGKNLTRKGCTVGWDAMIGRIGVVFTPLAITFGCHQVNRFSCLRMRNGIVWCLDKVDSIVQVGGLTYLPLWKKSYLIIYKEWKLRNDLHSSSLQLILHLSKILHKIASQWF